MPMTLTQRRERYATRKAAGLCPYCGKRPPYPGRASCLQCRKRHRYASSDWLARQQTKRRLGLLDSP